MVQRDVGNRGNGTFVTWPERIGPYHTLGLLGRGGQAVVLRAHHCETGEIAAIKIGRRYSEVAVAAIEREIRALRHLRHPGIVRILAHGVEDGAPWYAMEALTGQTLREYAFHRLGENPSTEAEIDVVAGAPSRVSAPPALSRDAQRALFAVLRRLCDALSYLHGEGIVHRDLKPENIIIRQSDADLPAAGAAPDIAGVQPVIIDFGMMSPFARVGEEDMSREALQLPGVIEGTPFFMAPEQIRGDLVDARADLYALGCLCYELMAGRPPFAAQTVRELLQMHLHAPPLPVSVYAPAVDPDIDELLLRLLRKDPGDRPGHADDVGAVLDRVVGSSAPPGKAAARPRAYLYRAAFSGREDALRELDEPFLRLERAQGSLVLIGGESGAGKTRLVMEIARRGRVTRKRVLLGEVTPLEATSAAGGSGACPPLQPVRTLLRTVAHLALAEEDSAGGGAAAERLLGRRAAVLAPYEPAVSALAARLTLPPPIDVPADLARRHVLTALTATLAAFSAEGPVVLILDDLQWADDLTIDWLLHLLGQGHLERIPVLVAATYRAEEVGAALAALVAAPGVRHVRVGGLAEADVVAIVGSMLGMSPPPRNFGRHVARFSEGNPFFIGEYLRAAIEVGALCRDASGCWYVADPRPEMSDDDDAFERIPLPRSVRELIKRRLAGLPARSMLVVQAAAVIGRQAPLSMLSAVVGLDRDDVVEASLPLAPRQIAREEPPGCLRFVHDKIREVAYEEIDEPRRCELHGRVAAAIDALPDAARADYLAVHGQHLLVAGLVDRARIAYRDAARFYAARHAPREAERLYRASLALTGTPTAADADVNGELAEVIYRLGRVTDAVEQHRCAFRMATERDDPAAVARSGARLAAALMDSGALEEAQALLQQALAAYRQLGNLSLFSGAFAVAEGLLTRAMAIHCAMGNRNGEAMALGNLGVTSAHRGHLESARQYMEAALVLHRANGNTHQEGIVLGNLASLLARDPREGERARQLFEQALESHREVGDTYSEGVVLGNLASLIAQHGGDPGEAGDRFAAAIEILERSGVPRSAAIIRVRLARLLRRHGHYTEAHTHLDVADAKLAAAHDTFQRGIARCEMGFLALASGATAESELCQAQRLAAELGSEATSDLSDAIARLKRAMAAVASPSAAGPGAGTPAVATFHGECVDDLPAGLRGQPSAAVRGLPPAARTTPQ
ncbi:MAG: protein kinase [Candidatus Schekmanbacteria bacterium]|nr:protein kinase [Candidatus Schekmanbacteria bacterium]